MQRRAGHHGFIQRVRRAGATRALALVVLAAAGVAQLAASWHEIAVQHVRCAEHGELTHVAAARGPVAPPSPETTAGADRTGAAESHEHCAVALTVRGGAGVSLIRAEIRFTPPPVVTRRIVALPLLPGRAFVLASAPKTSPPSA